MSICPTVRVLLAIRATIDLEVAVRQGAATVRAAKAPDVILDRGLVLHVLAFNAVPATAAEAAVELVVMNLAIGLVVENVELGGSERLRAGGANKARLVILAREAPIGRGYALTVDGQSARLAVATVRKS